MGTRHKKDEYPQTHSEIQIACFRFVSPIVVAAPHLITSSPSNSSIVVVWQPVANAVRYTLCIVMEGSNATVDVNLTSPNITFSDLEAGSVYAIKANAWDAMNRQGDDARVSQITRKHEAQELSTVECVCVSWFVLNHLVCVCMCEIGRAHV